MLAERIAIFVDGSNLYHYLRELKLTGLAGFDYKAFAGFLARGRTPVSERCAPEATQRVKNYDGGNSALSPGYRIWDGTLNTDT